MYSSPPNTHTGMAEHQFPNHFEFKSISLGYALEFLDIYSQLVWLNVLHFELNFVYYGLKSTLIILNFHRVVEKFTLHHVRTPLWTGKI